MKFLASESVELSIDAIFLSPLPRSEPEEIEDPCGRGDNHAHSNHEFEHQSDVYGHVLKSDSVIVTGSHQTATA